jgi:hypothetical protein
MHIDDETMTQHIQLTYMYDVPVAELAQCFSEQLLAHLNVHGIRVVMALRDFSTERAELIRRLNRARIPVVAWLVHVERDFRMHDAHEVAACFDAFQRWSTQHGLGWDAVALDIEPDMRDAVRFGDEPTVDLATLVRRTGDRWHIEAATNAYTQVLADIRAAGFAVELFEIPFVRDDRVSGTTIARRLLGIPDLVADRTVMQLQSSYVRPYGAGLIAAYAPEASSVMVGSLRADAHNRAITVDELMRDLGHVAACGITQIYIADMQEACTRPALTAAIVEKAWVTKSLPPADEYYQQVARMRAGVRALLWAGARPAVLLPLLIPVLLLVRRMLRTSTHTVQERHVP